MRFPQRITFTGSMIVDTDGLDFKRAAEVVRDTLAEAGTGDPVIDFIRVVKLEIVEED